MTIDEACRILKVNSFTNLAEIERAYQAKLQTIQMQLIPGQPISVRKRARQQMALYMDAWDMVKNTLGQKPGFAGTNQSPLPKPSSKSSLPTAGPGNWTMFFKLGPIPRPAVITSFVIATAMMLTIVILCFHTPAPGQEESTVEARQPRTATIVPSIPVKSSQIVFPPKKKLPAQLRVLSVPWCQVELAGKSLGPSGQAAAFQQEAGEYELTLRRNNRSLTRTIRLYEGQQTIVWVQFEKGEIHVKQE